ncbi:GNAT family N-acetyltransferase [Maritalea mediterranea]|uniref:GNAT family N-acetyltransferase n=1 Tax=Maritalea mediterranea TaxID=2909667 RepID=A0ABS9E4R6_9HYPH|nr:GNAT family N-acetyltransferase [Maritalea mediterranea]MCF4097857.1 GNAT family N-acetyltransferase [Maritalea mediterranea]
MDGKPLFESDRLVFSTWTPDQLEDVFRLHDDEDVGRYLLGRRETREDAQARMNEWAKNYARFGFCKFRLIRKSDGAFVGRAGFGVHGPQNTPELGYAILRSEWRKGYAKEAAVAIRDWLFRETDHDFCWGFAYTANAPSIHILRSIGMVFTHTETEEETGKELTFHKYTREMWRG